MTNTRHSHHDGPCRQADADMCDAINADESVYCCLGLIDGDVHALRTWPFLSRADTIRLLEQALAIVKGEEP